MAWSKPFDADELAYIEAAYPQVGAEEIARRLGRSRRGVENKIKQLGLTARRAPAREDPAPLPADPAPDGRLSDLLELKAILRATLAGDIAPKDIAKVSAEYRAVLAEIEQLEGGDGGNSALGDQGIDGLIGLVSLRTA